MSNSEEMIDTQNKPTDNNSQEEKTLSAESEIANLQKEVNELKDKYLRLVADFDNFRKRTAKERLELISVAAKDAIASMLPVLDDFERAEKQTQNAQDLDAVKEGISLVLGKLRNTLYAQGLKPMESLGQEFNPEFHDAITEIQAPSEDQKGKVLDEIQKGYYLNDKIIRHAKVVVGK